MKIEEQVLTIEQAKHLKELGLDMSDAVFCWEVNFPDTRVERMGTCHPMDIELVPTYTLQELLDKLPTDINYENRTYRLILDMYYEVIFYSSQERGYVKCFQNKMLIAVYEMLCWIVENGYLKEEKK